jgi:hypothetical protein
MELIKASIGGKSRRSKGKSGESNIEKREPFKLISFTLYTPYKASISSERIAISTFLDQHGTA